MSSDEDDLLAQAARGPVVFKNAKSMLGLSKRSIRVIQRNIRYWIRLHNWDWLELLKMVRSKSVKPKQSNNVILPVDDSSEIYELRKKLAEAHEEIERLNKELEAKDALNRSKDAEIHKLKVALEKAAGDGGRPVTIEKETITNDVLIIEADNMLQSSAEMAKLHTKLESMNKTLQSQNEQLKEAKMAYDRLKEENNRMQKKIAHLESFLNKSKDEQWRLEQEIQRLMDEISKVPKKIEQQIKKVEFLSQENATKDTELSKRNDQIAKMIIIHEREITDLHERQENLLSQLQDKYDQLHKKAIKHESENKQLKARIYQHIPGKNDGKRMSLSTIDSPLTRIQEGGERANGESSSLAGNRRSSNNRRTSGIDIIAVQLDDLEEQNMELIDDKRMMRKEIESLNRSLENSNEERQSLVNQMKASQLEITVLKRQVTKESEEKERFLQDVRQLQKQRTNDML